VTDEARVAARDYWLVPLTPEVMPGVATRLLSAGHESHALRIVAGTTPFTDPREVRQTFARALQEMAVWFPNRASAEEDLARELATALVNGQATPEQTSRRLRESIEVHGVFHPDPQHGAAWEEFTFVAWMREADEYERIGGDARLFAAARALEQTK
jgi:hypothetical protein